VSQPEPPILDGRYELLELLGEGGMGQVYKARHTRLGKIFAIKSLRNLSPDPAEQAKFLEAFESEARTLAELDHPALAQVSDFFEVDGVHFLVMEFVNGKTLSRVAELAPRLLSQRRILQWAGELCDVLDYLHNQNPPVIVRDLKPDNVMIDEKRRLRLLDFGIAKRLQAGVGTRDIIKGMGTAEYAPLEQYGAASTDQRSDIYALGGTLYFMLTEVPPPPAWRRASEGIEVRPPSQVNQTVTPDFERLVLRMMALKREDRPQSIAEVRAELKEILEKPAPSGRTESSGSATSGSSALRTGSASTEATGGGASSLPRVPPPPAPVPPLTELPKAQVPPPPGQPGLPRTPIVPPPPSYLPESASPAGPSPQDPAASHRYGLPGAALPHSRTEVKPSVAPPATGRVPRVVVQTVLRHAPPGGALLPRPAAGGGGRPLPAGLECEHRTDRQQALDRRTGVDQSGLFPRRPLPDGGRDGGRDPSVRPGA
jgi:serine/threonine protein kinase